MIFLITLYERRILGNYTLLFFKLIKIMFIQDAFQFNCTIRIVNYAEVEYNHIDRFEYDKIRQFISTMTLDQFNISIFLVRLIISDKITRFVDYLLANKCKWRWILGAFLVRSLYHHTRCVCIGTVQWNTCTPKR